MNLPGRILKTILVAILMNSTYAYSARTDTIELHKINDHVWVHTSYKDIGNLIYPSNGMILITPQGLILVDTSWDDELTEKLLKKAKEKFKSEFILAILTHAHNDRMGGIKTLKKQQIKTLCSKKTMDLAKTNGFETPDVFFTTDTSITSGNTRIEAFYPGGGHTEDNSVVWFPDYQVLFGGCIIKSLDSETLGNTKDADLKQWKPSLEKIKTKFRDVKIIVPGHGKWGDINLLNHTIELLK